MPSGVVRPCCRRIDDMSSVRKRLGRRRVACGVGGFLALARAAIFLGSIGLLDQVGDVGIVTICLALLTAGGGVSGPDVDGKGMHGGIAKGTRMGVAIGDWHRPC